MEPTPNTTATRQPEPPDADQRRRAMELDRRLEHERPGRPLLVGQAPGRGLDGWPALTGAVGDRLARLAGLAYPGARPALALMIAAERRNVLRELPAWQDLAPQDADPFPRSQARDGAAKILADLRTSGRLHDRKVIFCGRGVADVFGHGDLEFFTWRGDHVEHEDDLVGFWVSCIPHPSGRNRLWNDPRVSAAASAFLRLALDPEAAK